ncbi:GNA1162 family protein [Anaeromyxobacter oryzae]|uniref:Lipoprotein n=1 Tax=Anaeromyxobacter oryzae TaxID=2918170 RepID=A0ABM7X0E0_9BACT|nr:GNA1162 family protein [Anaeromyxobacter oryzae]BDG05261.1 lipoprotein [Anaeromyxobacter oryzae]
MTPRKAFAAAFLGLVALSIGCAGGRARRGYQDGNMDFGAIKTVAVLPFSNLSRDAAAADRVREIFSSMLLASGSVYVLPPGEVVRGYTRLNITDPRAPSIEDVTKLGGVLKADAVIRGVVKEYGEVRSGSSTGNVISVALEMYETSTGKIIWSATATKGGIGFGDRLLGGGGQPMEIVTEQVADELLNKLFR